jgi:hypothetical protein
VRNGRDNEARLRLQSLLDWKLELKEISPNLCVEELILGNRTMEIPERILQRTEASLGIDSEWSGAMPIWTEHPCTQHNNADKYESTETPQCQLPAVIAPRGLVLRDERSPLLCIFRFCLSQNRNILIRALLYEIKPLDPSFFLPPLPQRCLRWLRSLVSFPRGVHRVSIPCKG